MSKLTLSDKIKSLPMVARDKSNLPVWQGPQVEGITFSLLSRFLVCRERFRLMVIEGLAPAPDFNKSIEYGSMWHVCEEAHAVNGDWKAKLKDYCQTLAHKFPTQGKEIEHWYNICWRQFEVYTSYWSKHPDVVYRTPILQEATFNVPYQLPSGRIVKLRGKFDSVDLIGKGATAGVYLQENKSKGDIDVNEISRNLAFDLQTMIYIIALKQTTLISSADRARIKGVRYNVIRRPLAGGKHSIRPHKATKNQPEESLPDFYDRLVGLIKEDAELAFRDKQESFFFIRRRVEISDADIDSFKQTCLNPILEQLCDWYDWVTDDVGVWDCEQGHGIHYRLPFGVYNPLLEGRSSELDEYLKSGSTAGLAQITNLFPELT